MSLRTKAPSRSQAILFASKSWGLRFRQGLINLIKPPRRHLQSAVPHDLPLLAESISDLWTQTSDLEWNLTAGKVHNLRVAAARINGIVIPPGEVFSFWACLGRPTRSRGYAEGRELREGCLVPSIGGGLCQLSNGLYDAAQKAGLQIIERHAHSQIIPGSLAEQGRDATVFWNYLDLRFRSDKVIRLEAELDRNHLRVRILGQAPDPALSIRERPVLRKSASLAIGSCDTCGIETCHQNMAEERTAPARRQAFVLDGSWPEFDDYVQSSRSHADALLIPIDGAKWRRERYAWNTRGFNEVLQVPGLAVRRGIATRKLAEQGAQRQRALLDWDARIAGALADRIPYDADHLVVSQNLLPILWRSGAMGGRSFEVLLHRHPLSELQRLLDEAGGFHPDSRTLRDFRVDEETLRHESSALAQAQKVVTPHAAIARPFGERAELLPWRVPAPVARKGSRAIFFPASTLGRKGAYELRDALRGLDADLLLGGPELESSGFWDGIRTRRAVSLLGGLQEAAVVVLPAFIEHQPRLLLRALSSGIPVIASEACGIPPMPGLKIVRSGDASALKEALVLEMNPA